MKFVEETIERAQTTKSGTRRQEMKKTRIIKSSRSQRGQARIAGWLFVAAVAIAVASLNASCWASSETVLYRFGNAIVGDGKGVPAGLIADSSGNFYGVTQYGGSNADGTVFELSPGTGGTWTETILHSFGSGSDGSQPVGGLIRDASGNLYGTTSGGGSASLGAVVELTPSGSTWTETVLYSFTSVSDGVSPSSSLTMDGSGNLYGTTEFGGNTSGDCSPTGCGTVFKLAPGGGGSWTKTTLHEFDAIDDGSEPLAGVILDSSGNLYGTTSAAGGRNDHGTVFKLSTSGTLTTLYVFSGGSDGRGPAANLIRDSYGNLYGTTLGGGSHLYGTVFQLSLSGGVWNESVLYSFAGSGDDTPAAGLVFDGSGNLYGTTTGEATGGGTVFKLTPGPSGWTESVLHTFPGGGITSTDGRQPESTLIFDGSGNLYGTTFEGGAETTCAVAGTGSGCGTAFKVTP